MVVALGRCHRTDDRLHTRQLFVVHLGAGFRRLLQCPHARDHPEHLFERPHLFQRLELVGKILQRKVVEPRLLLELLAGVVIKRRFRTLDEGEHIAHPQHPGDEPVRMERLKILRAFADAHKGNRHPHNTHHRQGRATALVAVELGEHDTRDTRARVELARAPNRVLAGHRVGDIQPVGRVHRLRDGVQFRHQLIVDVQAPRGVDNQRVEPELFRGRQRPCGACDRVHLPFGIMNPDADLLRQHGKLLDGGRAPDVGGHEHGMFPLLREPLGQLRRCGRFARALQAQHQHHARRTRRFGQPAGDVTKQRQQLVAHDAHDLLIRRQAPEHFLAHRLRADAIDEGLDDPEVNVGFEERQTNFAQGGINGLFGEP